MAGIEGNVSYIKLSKNDAYFQPAGLPHFVLTKTDTIAFGANFQTMPGLPLSIYRYSSEKCFGESEDEMFPNYEILLTILLHVMKQESMSYPKPKVLRFFLDNMLSHDFQKRISEFQMTKKPVCDNLNIFMINLIHIKID